jgi:hypothetical protein
MKSIIAVIVLATLSGCATQHTMNGWDYGTALLERGPIVNQMPQSRSNGVSDIRTGTTTYNLPSGSYQVNTVGNTVTVIQTGKSR